MSILYNRYLNLNFQILLILLIVFVLSCKKFVEIGSPVDKLTTKKMFADSANATAAILGVYIDMASTSNTGLLYGGPSLYGGLLSDELTPASATFDIGQYYQNSVDPNNGGNSTDLWRFGYVLIYRVNACIEGLNESQGISAALKNQLTGEAKFMRALVYFYLTNFYGDVPLITSTDFQVNQSLSRTSVATVYDQITKDLIDAKNLIQENYVTVGRLRPNRSTVSALLARVCLFQKQWSKAEDFASEVISKRDLYGLASDLDKVFEPNSSEAIWQISPMQQRFETPDGRIFIPATVSSIPTYSISRSLLETFEINDRRRINWIAQRTINVSGQPTDFYFPFKYKLSNSGWTTAPIESYNMFRLGELYLIRAEARAQQDKLDLAKEDLNVIRNRAGLGNTSASSQTTLLDAIYREKQIEFFCEWGHRWFDLKRTERINTVMPTVAVTKNSTWNSNKQLLPIPREQIKVNPFLVQNPGYN